MEDANQISWKTALNTINARIKSRPDVESELLRHWRGVIGEAYAGFQANPVGYGPNPMTSMFFSMDGRTKDSTYPNLLLPKEREPYGL